MNDIVHGREDTSLIVLNQDSMANAPMYNGYQRLDRTTREIRIVTINGFTDATNDHPQLISCSLEQVPLDKANPFYALSYVWGPIDDTKPINVDGQIVDIRNNLWQFLEQLSLRFESSGLRVWLDYFCINQQDIEERNFQVSMMADIYRSADSVYAWIGPSSTQSDRFFETAEDLKLLRWQRMPHTNDSDLAWSLSSMWGDISDRNYWQRVWIIQEFILARDLWLFCGSTVTNWQNLESAIIQHAEQMRLAGSKALLDISKGPIRSLLQLRRLQQTDSLSNLTYKFRSAQCHESRDRIFGLLSLVDQSEAMSVTVDYNKPLLQLLLDTCNVWSDELASDLKGETHLAKRDDAKVRLLFSSMPKFCRAILGMMTLEDLEHLWRSEELRLSIHSRCTFMSSSPPRKISQFCTLATIDQAGTLHASANDAIQAGSIGYISALKETPASLSWLYAFTNVPIIAGGVFITIGNETLLLLHEIRPYEEERSAFTNSLPAYTVVAYGRLIEESFLPHYTRSLVLPKPSEFIENLLPDVQYTVVPIIANRVSSRPHQDRLHVEFSTAALVTMLESYRVASQAVMSEGNTARKWTEDLNPEIPSWSPWEFGLKHKLLRPCLKCKLHGHRPENILGNIRRGSQASTSAVCECEWVAPPLASV